MGLIKNNTKYWQSILILELNPYILRLRGYDTTKQFSVKQHLKKFQNIFKYLFIDAVKLFKKTEAIPVHKNWFFSISDNNFLALHPICERTQNAIMVNSYSITKRVYKGDYFFNFQFKFFHDLCFPFNFLYYAFKSPNSPLSSYDIYFQTNGLYSESLRLLKKYKPQTIVFANDHNNTTRALLLAAKALQITTVYVQHASVSKYFPPLIFNYALLEGEDAQQKYLSIAKTNTKIELIGMPKFDANVHLINTNTSIKVIGIAYNPLDSILKVEHLIAQLAAHEPYLKITVRAHPNDKRLVNFKNCTISDAKTETAFQFIYGIDMLIASNSSIHLEATLMNVVSIYYHFTDTIIDEDYYGYIENKLVDLALNFDALQNFISQYKHHKPEVQHKAKFYNAAIGSSFYGKSAHKAATIINQIVNA